MNFDAARHKMVVEQLEQRGIHDARVLAAMDWLPRHEFVPPESAERAYDNCALPIGLDQTISQPYTVAFMCQEAQIHAHDKVLEIGTGSGYGAAVLSRLAAEVHTIERIEELFVAARRRLARLKLSNIRVHLDDGALGLASEAPFDAIVVTAGAESVPASYQNQLAEGGRLIIPVGPPSMQQMLRITLQNNQLSREELGQFGFVPLIAGKAENSDMN